MFANNHTLKNNQAGYIALGSAIIISALLLALTFTVSTSGVYARFNILNFEHKKRSSALADACIDATLLRLAQNAAYVGSETIFIGSDTCQIGAIILTSGTYTIFANAQFQRSVTRLKVTASSPYLGVISWQEVP